ncbi:MAG: hypothetical protein RLO05_08010, partial [Rhodospirillales bacterium]
MTGGPRSVGARDRRRGRWPRAAALLLLGLLTVWPDVARAADQAVIIMYHRFGEQDYPTTNIRLDQFDEHLAELTSGKYTVMSLPDIIAAMKAG